MDAIWIPTMPDRRWIGAIFAVAVVLLGGCATEGKTDRQMARERANGYLAAHPQLDPKISEAIRELGLVVDMTAEQVTASWGKPVIVQKSINGTSELWYFPCDYPHFCRSGAAGRRWRSEKDRYQSRAFFVNGRLTEWQT